MNIRVCHATANNLKDVSLSLPLGQLVAVVGRSGSGKSSLVYDVLARAAAGETVAAKVVGLPANVFVVNQRVKPVGQMSLGETSLALLRGALKQAGRGDLLIVDEPCAGLAAADRRVVISLLRQAVAAGISVIAVEHSKDVIAAADYVIEFGPEAGAGGGEVVFAGPAADFRRAKTPTSAYVYSDRAARVAYVRRPNRKMTRTRLEVKGITKNHLHDFDLVMRLGQLVAVAGRIGTGKTTLLSVAYGALLKNQAAWKYREGFRRVVGKSNVRRTYLVGQQPLTANRRSTVATYLGIWDGVRAVFAALPESRRRRRRAGDFCLDRSPRPAAAVSEIRYEGRSILDVAALTVDEAARLFADQPLIARKLAFLQEVGLGYLTLGQPVGTLSGGEAQRVRLAKILAKKLSDRCLYILDVPSRGLHLADLPTLIAVFQKIIDKNNTVLIAENREEILKNCDQVIHL